MTTTPTRTDDYLEVRGLRVAFGDFVAVDGVDLTLLQGQVHFLVGPNGAGKTTIIDALTGLAPGQGVATHGGVNLLGKPSHRIAALGVGRTFQTATVFEELSVLQNLDIAGVRHRSRWSQLRARREVPAEVSAAAETIGLTHLLDHPAGVLSHGQKQWLEIGMLLVQDASVMLLDEPVAGMSAEEREETGELLRRIGHERTIVVVEHDMDFVRRFADGVTVLHAGRVLASGSMDTIRANPEVQRVYLGQTTEGAA
ncbi:urea ABC transporter ATP-binding protein UrtD [Janibacter sp. CX7]|uniref:urea ABC transporter ATP-binding protein UrtD n=1 Tax=Janibacter sp. CX7 TaxID=2963431 RepID=UPI0020CFD16E|nr:urea ABC transporter ATP-binding protein UrtD [Janibacter sp. CX7]UTT66180.1 urea ABC transporter ATP-binding protein UrtD [Janibacter sp. CX7]